MFVLSFSTTVVRNNPHFDKTSARYDQKRIRVFLYEALRESRGIASSTLFLDLGTRRG
jgi:hypothetical protein